MRNAFADELTTLAHADPRIILLSGDIGNRLFDPFKAQCPERFFNCGVAEQNMTGVAAGMAMSGLRPITYSITPFVTTRCIEQIKIDICYPNLPVVIVGVGAGLSYAGLGPTHHSCEDIAMLRCLPNMTILCPGDRWEVRACLRAAMAHDGPVYLRLGKKGEPAVHTDVPTMAMGDVIWIQRYTDMANSVCLAVTGNMLPVAKEAVTLLEQDGYSMAMVSVPCVKPLNELFLQQAFRYFPLVVTLEEHSVIGGFGSAVSEWLSRNPCVTQHLPLGLPDKFFHEAGEQEYFREQAGLTAPQIAHKIRKALKEI